MLGSGRDVTETSTALTGGVRWVGQASGEKSVDVTGHAIEPAATAADEAARHPPTTLSRIDPKVPGVAKESAEEHDARVIQLVYEVSRLWYRSKSAEGQERSAAEKLYNEKYPEVVRSTLAFYPSETAHAWAAVTIHGTATTSAPSVWPQTMWPDGKDIWLTAENLYALARQFLDNEGAFYLRIELAAIQGDLLTLVDKRPNDEEAKSAFALSRKRIDTARSNFKVGALARATSDYLLGMLAALAVVAPASLALGWLIGLALPWKDLVLGATACAIAGQFGALVSVLTRISGSGLDLDYRAGKRMLFVVGFARPVLGAIFASALYFATVGGVVPLKAPTDPLTQFAFFIGIGFIAGFSERYAQDMLSVSPKDEAAETAASTAAV